MNEIEIPMFDKGDIVKDKFGNLFVIEDLVSPQQLEQDSPEYDHMGYRLKIIEKNPSSPARKVGNVSGFYSDGACMWIYNTSGDAVYLDDMQDFDPDISIELQSKCFVPVIKGSVGLRNCDFEAIKSYFGVANIN